MEGKLVSNYSGIAKPRKGENGEYFLVACDYNQVGIYSVCVKMEDGNVTAIGLGGFNEKIAFKSTDEKRSYPVFVNQ